MIVSVSDICILFTLNFLLKQYRVIFLCASLAATAHQKDGNRKVADQLAIETVSPYRCRLYFPFGDQCDNSEESI